jgi:hypothetical protein
MAEKKDSKVEKKEPKDSNERTYLVKYRLSGEKGRNPRKVLVQALNQSDAKKTAIATIPGAEVVGGAKEMNEGVMDFAGRVGKFAARCVGRACHAYSKTPIRDTGSISTSRKILTRELAHLAGNKLMDVGGGETRSLPKVKITTKKSSKPKKTTRRKRK